MPGTPSRSLLFPSLDKRADAIPAIPAGSRAGPSTAAGCALLNVSLPQNPVYELPLPARVRDPAVALAADGTYERRTLGSDVENGETPQLVVAGGTYKAAVLEPGAEFALIGEGVSPGFDFRDFEFVAASALMTRNAACFDDANHLIKPSPEDTFDHYYQSTPTASEDYFTPTRDDDPTEA